MRSSRVDLSSSSLEVRFGPKLLALCAGFITALVLCAYYLGLVAGRSVGFESALQDSASQLARIPIDTPPSQEGGWDQEMQSTAQDIFARLNSEKITPKTEEKPTTNKGPSVEELLAVPSGSLPEMPKKPEASSFKASGKDSQPEGSSSDSAQVRVLGKTSDALSPSQGKGNVTSELIQNDSTSLSTPSGLLPRGYFVQVASSPKKQDLNSLFQKLKSSGFPVVLEENVARSGKIYRLLVGPEENSKIASRLVSQVARESYVTGKPFLRQVK